MRGRLCKFARVPPLFARFFRVPVRRQGRERARIRANARQCAGAGEGIIGRKNIVV